MEGFSERIHFSSQPLLSSLISLSWWERPFDLNSSISHELVPWASEFKGATLSLCTDQIFIPQHKLARAQGHICCALCLQFHWESLLPCASLPSTAYTKSHRFLERSWHQACSAACRMVPGASLLNEKGCSQAPDVDGKSFQTEEWPYSLLSFRIRRSNGSFVLHTYRWRPERKVLFSGPVRRVLNTVGLDLRSIKH